MAKVNSIVTIHTWKIKQITTAQIKAFEKTGEALHTAVIQEQVMPRDTGHLQNDSTFVDYSQEKSGTISIISQTPYARRLYYHPEYNFRRVENSKAQGKWFEPWISGSKKDWCWSVFKKFFKQESGI